MYDHEHRERKNNGEIQHLVMPARDLKQSGLMYAYLSDRELDYELALANGWYPTMSRGPRVVIPCINSAKFNYWQARDITGTHPLRYDSPAIPRKDSIVFLWPPKESGALSLARKSSVVITEGPMDALAAAEFLPAIALMGGAPSQEVISFVESKTSELGLDYWIIVPDNDNTALVESFIAGGRVEIRLPSGKDLAGMPRWEREKLLCKSK